ncbi:MAG: M23 family metallopeptidase [Spirochaetales bacterium]|nr:M23 family metallopeptidase [Spirochaetales bacterium]
MIRRLLFAILVFISVFSLYGFQWPVSNVVLISTFGESEIDEYVKGLDIGGGIQDVRSIDAGELVFYSHQGASPLDLPSGLGAYVIYQHKNGIRSLYGHLENNSLNTDKYKVDMSDKIGTVGTTGTAVGAMLHLQVIDTEFEKYINPLLSLPLLEDHKKPVIKEVYLKSQTGKIVLGSEKVIKSGVYSLSADIRDMSENAGYYCPLAPYSISLFMNGENLANINFESMKVRNGEMLLEESEGISHNEMYLSDWEIFIGNFEFNPGDIMIEISVKDFAGNEGIKMFSLKVAE